MDNINIDKSIYNQESLSLLNIRDLRDIGRTFGVPSPTTKSKDDLIDYILKILYGEIKGETRSTRGRPNNRSFDMDKYVAEIKKRSIVKPSMFEESDDGYEFSLKLASPNTSHSQDLEIKQRVFVKDDGGAYLRVHGFVESPEDVKVSQNIQLKYKLENFDMVEIIEAGGLFKIVSINGQKTINNLEKLEVLEHTFENGGSKVFHFGTKEEEKEQIDKLCSACAKQGIKCMVFTADEYSGLDADVVKIDADDGDAKIYKNLMQFVAQIEKSLFDGESVVVVMTAFDVVEKAIDSFDEKVAERTKKHLQDKQEKLVSLGNVLLSFKVDKTDVIY